MRGKLGGWGQGRATYPVGQPLLVLGRVVGSDGLQRLVGRVEEGRKVDEEREPPKHVEHEQNGEKQRAPDDVSLKHGPAQWSECQSL